MPIGSLISEDAMKLCFYDRNITVILKFRKLHVFDTCNFFILPTCLLYMLTISDILDCQFDFGR